MSPRHLPIALLLALCAMLAVATAQSGPDYSCEYRYLLFSSTSCEGEILDCSQVSHAGNALDVCNYLYLDDNTYYSHTNCTTKQLQIYTTSDCSGSPITSVTNGNCNNINGLSLRLSFDSTCGSAAALQSWVSVLV